MTSNAIKFPPAPKAWYPILCRKKGRYITKVYKPELNYQPLDLDFEPF